MPKNMFPFRLTCVVLAILLTTKGKSLALKCPVPVELHGKLHSDPLAIESASTDFGNIVHYPPASVLYPSSVQDIQTLIKSSYNCSYPFVISIRGNGHATHGQDMAPNGVVVDMQEYKNNKNGTGIFVSKDPLFADVGAELLWQDVLNFTLQKGVLPVSWTDYLGLSVGGTLSNAGISGFVFRVGPQISNVYELDVITGKGELVTCSTNRNPEVFFAVLGGLGQFGVITRARIAVEPAREKVRWLKILYSDFDTFTNDQQNIIAKDGRNQIEAMGFMDGQILLDNGTPNVWATSFFSSTDLPEILSLVSKYGVIYCIEIAEPYNNGTELQVDQKLDQLMEELNPISGMVYQVDVPYTNFLQRIQQPVLKNESHPWLDLFVPKSRISVFNSGVIREILLKRNITFGPVLLYPVNRNKWDDRMSVSIPDEDFYILSILITSRNDDWERYYDQIDAIIDFCDEAGIKYKEYLPPYSEEEQWIKHFGSKWETIQKRKNEFDPKKILSPQQKIFN